MSPICGPRKSSVHSEDKTRVRGMLPERHMQKNIIKNIEKREKHESVRTYEDKRIT